MPGLNAKGSEFYPKYFRKPLNDFKKGNDIVRFILYKNPPCGALEDELEGGQS